MIKSLLVVGLGGGIGSMLRYLCQRWIYHYYPYTFPWGTFIVNISGCFLIGIIYAIAERTNLLNPEWRLFLATGLCGGYTTFSTFAFENMVFLKNGDSFYFILYTLLSVITGIAAVFGAIAIIKLL